MNSSFTLKACIFPVLAAILIGLSFTIIKNNSPIIFEHLRWIDYFMTILFVFTLIWLLYLQTYKKLVRIKLSNDKLCVTDIFQYATHFLVSDLEGYQTSINIMGIGNFEEIRIKRKGKTVIFISEFYHRNYWEMKKEVHLSVKYLGGPAKNDYYKNKITEYFKLLNSPNK